MASGLHGCLFPGVVGGASVPLMGRDRELAQVMLVDGAVAGRGRLVLCTGESGIGKTRLAEETVATGVPVAWAPASDAAVHRTQRRLKTAAR